MAAVGEASMKNKNLTWTYMGATGVQALLFPFVNNSDVKKSEFRF